MAHRSDYDIASGAPITVMLGERSFTIAPLPLRKAQSFREAFAEAMTGIECLPMIADRLIGDGKSFNITPEDLLNILATAIRKDVYRLINVMFSWGDLAKDREYIEEHATEYQAVEALVAMAMLAYGPFGVCLPQELKKLRTAGQTTSETGTDRTAT